MLPCRHARNQENNHEGAAALMSVGEIAGLIAAVAFVLLVGAVAIPLIKLGSVLDETGRLVGGVTEQTVPLLGEVTTSVVNVNVQLERVDRITGNVEEISNNVTALAGIFSATLGGPLVKVASFTYGVRRAAGKRQRQDIEGRVKRELKVDRRAKHARRPGKGVA
jgi:hypothetical protein